MTDKSEPLTPREIEAEVDRIEDAVHSLLHRVRAGERVVLSFGHAANSSAIPGSGGFLHASVILVGRHGEA